MRLDLNPVKFRQLWILKEGVFIFFFWQTQSPTPTEETVS